jgi:hypothetical protein
MRSQHHFALLATLFANLHSAWISSKRRSSGVCYPMPATSLLHHLKMAILPISGSPTSRFTKNGWTGYESLLKQRERQISNVTPSNESRKTAGTYDYCIFDKWTFMSLCSVLFNTKSRPSHKQRKIRWWMLRSLTCIFAWCSLLSYALMVVTYWSIINTLVPCTLWPEIEAIVDHSKSCPGWL